MIIISDIHGRQFWKPALIECGALSKDGTLNEDVLFMGDYLDHYYNEYDPSAVEYITYDTEFENFKSIIRFKQEHPSQVTLLLGNHDMEYISSLCAECRVNVQYRKQIEDTFLSHIDLFKIGTYEMIGEKLVTFTHANICGEWLQMVSGMVKDLCGDDVTPDDHNGQKVCRTIIDSINALISKCVTDRTLLDEIGRLVCQVGCGRGGDYRVGSIVWADLLDYTQSKYIWDDVYQVVAHTQHLVKDYKFVYNEDMFCTDCHIEGVGNRVLFRLNDKWEPINDKSKYKTCLKLVETDFKMSGDEK